MKKFIGFALLVLPTVAAFGQSSNKTKNDTVKTKEIEEVVIVGFGKQKKTDLTSAISVVSEKAIEGRPINNVVEALKGTAASLSFNTGTGGGQLNNSASFNIRGAGTIGNTSSAPLVLIDGLEGDLSKLNPRDVESISILKDASSAAVYGSRAAFGVLLVTTKSGKRGKPSISYDLISRYSTPLLVPDMLDSENFAYYFNDAGNNSGQGVKFTPDIIEKIIQYKNGEITDQTSWNPTNNDWNFYLKSWANNNWFKEFYRSWVPSSEHNLSVRGGAEKATYYFSANFLGQDGLMRYNPDHLNRYSLNGKIKADLFPFLNLSYSSRFVRSDYDYSPYMNGLFYHNIARRWPTVPLVDPNGNYAWGNEIPNLLRSNAKNQQDITDHQMVLLFTPVKNWVTNFEANYKIENFTTHTVYLPLYRYNQDGIPVATNYQTGAPWDTNGGSNVSDYYCKTNSYKINLYSTYEKTLRELHNFKVMAGLQTENYRYNTFTAGRDQIITDDVTQINATGGKNMNVAGGAADWATHGVFGRLNYDYDKKYLFEANIRYDGSSRYLRSLRWRWFPSFSAGWNVAREGFWRDNDALAKITQFKFRGSYGSLGNTNTDLIGYYPFYLTQPFTVQGSTWLINGVRPNVASAPGMISVNSSWENVASTNFGLTVTALRNRFNLNFDYFIRRTLGMVGSAPDLPSTLGTAVAPYNNSDLKTKGFELELTWNDKIGEDFSYQIRGVLSDAQSEITKFNNATGTLGNYYVGRKFGEIWGYTTHGLAKSTQEISDWLATHNQSQIGGNWAAGDIMYEDLNGDGKINSGANTLADHGDLSIIGNSTPRYNFGLNLDLQYKNIDLSVFFQGVGKRDYNVGAEPYFVGANVNQWQAAAFSQHLDYFRPEDTSSPLGPNVDSYYPRPLFDQGAKNFQTQTRWLQNAAYLRLKNVQIGYTFPKSLLDNIGISNVRLYVTGENLVTWTKLSEIFDPETIDGSWGLGKVYPLSRIFATGLSVNF